MKKSFLALSMLAKKYSAASAGLHTLPERQ
jgi:hypothetical protein